MTKRKEFHGMRPDQDIRDANGKKCATLRYRTLDDMTNALDWAMQYSKETSRYMSSQRRDSEKNGGWTGCNTPEQYRDYLRDGWALGVDHVEGLEGLSSDAHERMTFVRNVGGVFPVVPAYLAGAPDAMLDVRPEPTDSVRGVTLVIDSSFHSGVSAATALDYAQSVMRLVAWLQAERIETSVYIVCPIMFKGKRYIYTTPIRETGQILQPERIAAVVHPSWLRRAWFAMIEREYYDYGWQECDACRHGYGHVQHATADEMRQCLPEAYSVIMLPKVGSGDPSKTVRDAISLKLRKD